MGWFSKSSNEGVSTPWIDLTSEEQLTTALNESATKSVFIFKHSTRCSISSMAKQRFEREWITPAGDFVLFYLDLLNHRPISNKIEELTGVEHQSPQLIVVKDGKVVYQNSHSSISAPESVEVLTK